MAFTGPFERNFYFIHDNASPHVYKLQQTGEPTRKLINGHSQHNSKEISTIKHLPTHALKKN